MLLVQFLEALPVTPVDATALDFQSAVRADLDRELGISEAGMPSRAASLEETGRYAPGISSSSRILPGGASTLS